MAKMSQQDFDKLCQSIMDKVSTFTKTFGIDLNDLGGGSGQSKASPSSRPSATAKRSNPVAPNAARQATQRPAPSTMPFAGGGSGARFRSSLGLTAAGLVFTILGVADVLIFGLTAIFGPFLTPLSGITLAIAVEVFLFALIGLGVWSLIVGIRRLNLSRNLDAFRRIFGNREVCTFQELADRTQTSVPKARSAARRLIKRGYIPQGRLDEGETCLIVTEDAYRLYQQTRQAHLAQEQERRTEDERRKAAQSVVAGLPPEAAAFVREGRRCLVRLHDLDEAIADDTLSGYIVTIEDIIGRIIERVEDEPGLVDSLHRLTDYYLPTTIKLLAAYEELESQPIQGDNITSSRREIEETLEMLQTGYAKMLDSTYQDLTMDVSSDAAVLQAMLAREGLTDNPFDVKPGSSPADPAQTA